MLHARRSVRTRFLFRGAASAEIGQVPLEGEPPVTAQAGRATVRVVARSATAAVDVLVTTGRAAVRVVARSATAAVDVLAVAGRATVRVVARGAAGSAGPVVTVSGGPRRQTRRRRAPDVPRQEPARLAGSVIASPPAPDTSLRRRRFRR